MYPELHIALDGTDATDGVAAEAPAGNAAAATTSATASFRRMLM